VAIGRGEQVLGQRSFRSAQRHAVDLLPTIDGLRREFGAEPGGIGTVFVSVGPGSFTGLRLGLAAARTLAFALGARVVGIPSMDVTAQNALQLNPRPTQVAVLLDAKRGRVYAATFRWNADVYAADSLPAEVDPAWFLARLTPDFVILGEGNPIYQSLVQSAGFIAFPEELHVARAETLYRLGHRRAQQCQFDDPRSLVPIYVRPPEAEEKYDARRSASPRPD
jgi:tRNA threonylcarbamoyladenosine biosynthesis protein TsaB